MKILTTNNNQVAVVFSKHDLLAMKDGKTLNADMVADGRKYQFVFVRDRTFEQTTKKWEAAAKRAVESAAKSNPSGVPEQPQPQPKPIEEMIPEENPS